MNSTRVGRWQDKALEQRVLPAPMAGRKKPPSSAESGLAAPRHRAVAQSHPDSTIVPPCRSLPCCGCGRRVPASKARALLFITLTLRRLAPNEPDLPRLRPNCRQVTRSASVRRCSARPASKLDRSGIGGERPPRLTSIWADRRRLLRNHLISPLRKRKVAETEVMIAESRSRVDDGGHRLVSKLRIARK